MVKTGQWFVPMPCRLANLTQPSNKQRWRNTKHLHYHQYNRAMHGQIRMHGSRKIMNSNNRGGAQKLPVRTYTLQLTINKGKVQMEFQPYWSLRDGSPIINGISIKCRRIILAASLQDKALKQLHLNHLGIEKKRLLVCLYMY